MATHLGVSPQDHVTLELIGGANDGFGPSKFDWVRNLPDGSSSGIFRVSRGRVLVITDVDWAYNSGKPGTRQQLRLFVFPLSDPNSARRHFESSVILGPAGEGGVSESMTSGFLVAAGARIGVDVTPGPIAGPNGTLAHAILRGYLTAARPPAPGGSPTA